MSADAMHAPAPTGSGRGHRYLSLPHTTLGVWSVVLFVTCWIFLALFFGAVSLGARGLSWQLLGTMIPAVLSGIGGLAAGLLSLVRKGERSLLVFLAVAWGTFVTWFVSMEIIFPH